MTKCLLYIILAALFLISCEGNEEKRIKVLVSSTKTSEGQTIKLDKNRLPQYEEIELKMNEQYIEELKQLVENNFENQLNLFEDKELGIFATYKKMFRFVFTSKKSWENYQHKLGVKYFNNQQLERSINELSQSHIDNVKALRTQFYANKFDEKKLSVDIEKLNLSTLEISLHALRFYSSNSLIIEFSSYIFYWLLGILIGWCIGEIIGSGNCLVNILVFVIGGVISMVIFYINDKKMIDSLREQEPKLQIDYDAIKQETDNNTIYFYESIK